MEATANAGRWDSLKLRDGQPLVLHESILGTLGTLGFEQMTPVQAACIPLFAQHYDVATQAVSRSFLTEKKETTRRAMRWRWSSDDRERTKR